MKNGTTIRIRGQVVRLVEACYMRGWYAYQGGDYFEFRTVDAAATWRLSRSLERDPHDPANVVAQGCTMQEAADEFARSIDDSDDDGALSGEVDRI